MTDVTMNLHYVVCFGDDLDIELYMFQGTEDEPVHTSHYDIEAMAEEFLAVRSNLRTGKLESSFAGDADCLAQRLRNAAQLLEKAVEEAYAD